MRNKKINRVPIKRIVLALKATEQAITLAKFIVKMNIYPNNLLSSIFNEAQLQVIKGVFDRERQAIRQTPAIVFSPRLRIDKRRYRRYVLKHKKSSVLMIRN